MLGRSGAQWVDPRECEITKPALKNDSCFKNYIDIHDSLYLHAGSYPI